jgi:myo-inositol 2-dehydrogenase / D-chiro-inositol 1-dehydrogenase
MNNYASPSNQNTSRRAFIKTSTTAAITGALTGPLIFTSKSRAAGGETLKVGLIGCGGRGSGAALQALKADPNTELTAMADAFASQIQDSLKNLRQDKEVGARIKVTPDRCFAGLDAYQKVIDSGIDVVLLASPPGFRPVHLKAAVTAGKHIFCEKPMGTDPAGVRSVLESAAMARDKKLALVAGFCWRYDPPRREFYRRIHDGAVGEIRAIHASYLTGPVKPMPPANQRPAGMSDVEWQVRNWYNFVWLSGDGLVEQACHSIDKIAWTMNGVLPLKAGATGGRQIPNNEGNIYDHIDVFYEFPNQVRALMAQRQIALCHSEVNDYVMGSAGVGSIKGGPVIEGKQPWTYSGPQKNMYQVEHDELFASIRKGQPINDGTWMAHSTLMAIMGRMAAYTGKEVTWEQALNSKLKLVPDQLDWNTPMPIAPMATPGKTELI